MASRTKRSGVFAPGAIMWHRTTHASQGRGKYDNQHNQHTYA